MEDPPGVSGWSAKFDVEEVSRNGGLAFREGNLFAAEIELGVEKVVVTDDEKAVVVKQG